MTDITFYIAIDTIDLSNSFCFKASKKIQKKECVQYFLGKNINDFEIKQCSEDFYNFFQKYGIKLSLNHSFIGTTDDGNDCRYLDPWFNEFYEYCKEHNIDDDAKKQIQEILNLCTEYKEDLKGSLFAC